jgi:hypothetical protein
MYRIPDNDANQEECETKIYFTRSFLVEWAY